jgi:uncharacterized protein
LREEYQILIEVIISFITLYSFGFCLYFAAQYSRYKGYPSYFIILGFLHIFGIAFLFLLDNKNKVNNNDSDRNEFYFFSCSSILISFYAIFLFLFPIFIIVLIETVGLDRVSEYLDNEDIFSFFCFLSMIVYLWYFHKEIKKANLNLKYLIGSFKKIDFKLPIILTVINVLFDWGFNRFTLYGLSFLVPKYVENYINQEHTATYFGFIASAIVSIIFAPIWEEIFYRGILFHKIALSKGIIFSSLSSSLIFAVFHLRYDVIPLCIGGIIYVILYLKTKKMIISIFAHFFHNVIAELWLFHHQFISNYDRSVPITISQYKQNFLDDIGLNIIFIALSAPYLIYFIYKNFPRNYDVNKLPYFANQED